MLQIQPLDVSRNSSVQVSGRVRLPKEEEQKLLRSLDVEYPGLSEICRRADELEKITPFLVRGGDGLWHASSDPRWQALCADARRVIGD